MLLTKAGTNKYKLTLVPRSNRNLPDLLGLGRGQRCNCRDPLFEKKVREHLSYRSFHRILYSGCLIWCSFFAKPRGSTCACISKNNLQSWRNENVPSVGRGYTRKGKINLARNVLFYLFIFIWTYSCFKASFPCTHYYYISNLAAVFAKKCTCTSHRYKHLACRLVDCQVQKIAAELIFFLDAFTGK